MRVESTDHAPDAVLHALIHDLRGGQVGRAGALFSGQASVWIDHMPLSPHGMEAVTELVAWLRQHFDLASLEVTAVVLGPAPCIVRATLLGLRPGPSGQPRVPGKPCVVDLDVHDGLVTDCFVAASVVPRRRPGPGVAVH